MRRALHLPAVAAALLLLAACVMPRRDEQSAHEALELKAESLAMLVHAADPPDAYAAEIGVLQGRLDAAARREAGKAANAKAADAWAKMADPKGGLMGSFLAKWQDQGRGFPRDVLNDLGAKIGAEFDRLAALAGADISSE